MPERKGRPKIRRGTPPTSANPYPSNQITKQYPDGSWGVTTPPPTPKVIAEYEKAIADAPEDAGLRMHFAFSLCLGENTLAAIRQAREAARLRPEWEWPHSFLAASLCETGNVDEAVEESRKALQLRLQKGDDTEQSEAVLRWASAEALLRKDEAAEAQQELEQAVHLQRKAMSKQRGSEQLLRMLEGKLLEWSGAS